MTLRAFARCEGMSQNDDEPMLKPDGHRYERPESRETTVSKEVVYAILGLVAGYEEIGHGRMHGRRDPAQNDRGRPSRCSAT